MNNNKAQNAARPEDEQCIRRAQKRLLDAYSRMQLKRGHGGWRAIANARDLNVRYVYELAVKGIVPPNPEMRRKLGLPRVMPSERNRKPKPPFVRIGEPGWEERYFRKLGKSR